ncbi:hypothetical protein NZ698_15715 [Chryseobacterium sp. PBS4-4]|uniref:Uncharacterized protein n=1 Tax=Chryseobacterium edaphi TaxID=2976532 RepID=A0ABT2W8U6_9FLAO|nr:hypothetical protein [Chryseobacterium edaphi]MCU7618642.1 hypothetical protein [Chryseobacterium edaphi]
MAIWQYTLIFIPINNFEENYKKFICQIETDYRKETYFFWENYYLNKNSITEKINSNISGCKSETKNSIFWKGDAEKFKDNDCDLIFDGDSIIEFTIRFDLRDKENTKTFIDLVLKTASEHQLKFMNLKYHFFEANRELLIKDIMESNAVKFLTNPEEFLASLTDNK